jgi:chaperone required for assembly of F1-ATPase
MRRFYQAATAAAVKVGYAVLLDDKPVRTPAKQALAVPTAALAEAIAAEWRGQGDTIDLNALPLTRIASTAIDLVAPRHGAIVDAIAKYAGTDLVCYRSEHPPALAERQREAWQPLIDWLALRYDAPLAVTTGILPIDQPAASLQALHAELAAQGAMTLAALHLLTAACGSLVVALALAEGRLDADSAFATAQLDETFEIEQWGEDAEQTQRRAALRQDIAVAARFLALMRG